VLFFVPQGRENGSAGPAQAEVMRQVATPRKCGASGLLADEKKRRSDYVGLKPDRLKQFRRTSSRSWQVRENSNVLDTIANSP